VLGFTQLISRRQNEKDAAAYGAVGCGRGSHLALIYNTRRVQLSSVEFSSGEGSGSHSHTHTHTHADILAGSFVTRSCCTGSNFTCHKHKHKHRHRHTNTRTPSASSTLIKLMPLGTFASGALPPSNFNMSVHYDGGPAGLQITRVQSRTGSNWLIKAAE